MRGTGREREIARLGLLYGAQGWKPLAPNHADGMIDPIGSILLEVDATHPAPSGDGELWCPRCGTAPASDGFVCGNCATGRAR